MKHPVAGGLAVEGGRRSPEVDDDGGGGNRFGRRECGCASGAGGGGGLCSRRELASILEQLDDVGCSGEIGGAPVIDFLARPVLESFEELEVGLLGGEALNAKEQGGEGEDVLLGGSHLSKVGEGLLGGESTVGRAELGN